MPNIQVKLRRGTTAQHAGFTGAEGEVTVDTDKETVIVHDGSTAGGHELAKSSDVAAAYTHPNHTGDVTSTGDGATVITDNAVTSAKISDSDDTFKVSATDVVVNEGGADVDFRVEGDTDTNLINTDAANDAVGVGIAAESGYALKCSRLKIERTGTQMYIKDSDETGTPTEIAISLNEKALRFGFQDNPTTQAFAIFGRNLTIAGGTVAQLNAVTAVDGALQGQIAMCSNGDAGDICLAIYTGTYGSGGSWKILATPGNTISAS